MLQKIESVYLSGSMVLKTNLNMINMVLMFTFSVSDQTFPFCVNFVKNFQNSKIQKMKLGTKMNFYMLNSMLLFTFSVLQ